MTKWERGYLRSCVCPCYCNQTSSFFKPNTSASLCADRDFEPPGEEEDDEETIEVEEQQEGNDAESHQREIELLKEESMLPLDQLLSTLKLPPPQVTKRPWKDFQRAEQKGKNKPVLSTLILMFSID